MDRQYSSLRPSIRFNRVEELVPVVESVAEQWSENARPELILSLISDHDSENYDYLTTSLQNLLESTTPWMVVDAKGGFLTKAADEALKSLTEERAYLHSHREFIKQHGKLKNKPLTFPTLLVLCNESDTKPTVQLGNFLIFQSETEDIRDFNDYIWKLLLSSNRPTAKDDDNLPAAVLFAGKYLDSLGPLVEHLGLGLPVLLLEDSSALCRLLAESLRLLRNSANFDHFQFLESLRLSICRISGDSLPVGGCLTEDLMETTIERILKVLQHSTLSRNSKIQLVDSQALKSDPTLLARKIVETFLLSSEDKDWVQERVFPLIVRLNEPSLAKSAEPGEPAMRTKWALRLFIEAVRYPGREAMVGFFLESGFNIGNFLNSDILWRLFTECESQDFFENVILCRVLGYSSYPTNQSRLLKRQIPELVDVLSHIPHLFPLALLYSAKSDALLSRSADLLAFWAILMNRGSLAKLFTAYSANPIPLALILAEMSRNLAKESVDWYVYEQPLRKLSADFSAMATALLDTSYQSASHRSYDILSRPFPQFGGLTATHLALLSDNKSFLAHESSQVWVSRRLYDRIQLTRVRWTCGFPVPPWVKILSSAFFIFPMHWWVRLRLIGANRKQSPDYIIAMHSQQSKDGGETVSLLEEDAADNPALFQRIFTLSQVQRELSVEPPAPIYKLLLAFYKAPIVKYWISLFFRLVHLLVFAYSLSLPSCGSFIWDTVAWSWSCLTWFETAALLLRKRSQAASLDYRTYRLELGVTAGFLVGTAIFKIFAPQIDEMHDMWDPFAGRCLMSLFFLFLCYSTIFTYIPMSEALGPLLIRAKLMIMRDFRNYLILTSIVIVASGIVVHAIVFPDYPEGPSLWHQAMHWAGFSLFTADISYLKEPDSCETKHVKSNVTEICMRTSGYTDPYCPRPSTAAYLAVIQYFVILKLISWPLLFALFANTAKEVDQEADSIWKHQLYSLASDFSLRSSLPPPLNILVPLVWLKDLVHKKLCCSGGSKDKTDEVVMEKILTERSRMDPYYEAYWRNLALKHLQISPAEGPLRSTTTQVIFPSSPKIKISETAYAGKIYRLEVDKEYTDFSILLPSYHPPLYSKPREEFNEEFRPIVMDKARQYLNPHGRQGVGGRGNLPKFGPNRFAVFVTPNRTCLMTSKPNSIFQSSSGVLKLFVNSAEGPVELLREITAEENPTIRSIFIGPLMSDISTDSAWVEIQIFSIASHLPFSSSDFKWAPASSNTENLAKIDAEISKLVIQLNFEEL